MRERLFHSFGWHVAAALMKDEVADLAVVAFDECDLRIDHLQEELSLSRRVYFDLSLVRGLREKRRTFTSYREAEFRSQFIDARISVQRLGRQADFCSLLRQIYFFIE